MKSLCRGLQDNESLTSLNLSHNPFSSKGFDALGRALMTNPVCHLRILTCKNINAASFEWVPNLFSVQSLTELRLGHVCSFGHAPQFCTELVKVLPTLTNLTVLKLQRNNLADQGPLIVKALSNNTTLTAINLNWNYIGEGEPEMVIGDDAMETATLMEEREEEIKRRYNEGVGSLLEELLLKNSALRCLSFKGNHLTSYDKEHLVKINTNLWNRVDLKLEPQIEKIQ